MPIIFARYLPRLDRLCRLILVGSIDSFTPVHSALQLADLSRSTPVGSIHHALLCRPTRGVMSSRTDGENAIANAFATANPSYGGRDASAFPEFAADTAAATEERLDAAHSTSLRAGLMAAIRLRFCSRRPVSDVLAQFE